MPSSEDPWEDIPSEKVKREGQVIDRPSSPSSSAMSSPRRRSKRQAVANSPRKSRSKPASRTAPPVSKAPKLEAEVLEPPPMITTQEALTELRHFIVFAFKYTFDLLRFLTMLMKWPLGFFIFLWLISTMFAAVSETLRTILSPICIIPGTSRLPFCSIQTGGPQWADYPELVNLQTRSLQLLEDSVNGSGLSLDIKRGELAAADLANLVQFSDLTSKTVLATSLREFVQNAKGTGQGLQRLNAKIGGAVDNIMAVNDYALQQISGIDEPSALATIVPWIFGAGGSITTIFSDSMDTMNHELKRLIMEAEVNLLNLNVLEEKLSSIHELVHREKTFTSSARDDLLSQLWTILGGNRKQLKGVNDNLRLLQDLSTYRRKARSHVIGALTTLQGMQADMEDLRDRVAAPELAGSRIPLEVHMKAIQNGLERLKEGRIDAKQRESENLARVLALAGS